METLPHTPGSGFHLSVVATARNDNHGGHLLRRIQTFINCLCEQSDTFRVPVELVLVDWNPPGDRPPLQDALQWPTITKYFGARVVTVPLSLHQLFKHSSALPLYQMIAKNVGIRRCLGDFVLCTNIDIVLEDAVFEFIAKGGLTRGCIYRTDRYDVNENIPEGVGRGAILRHCRENVVRINTIHGSFNLETNEASTSECEDEKLLLNIHGEGSVHTNACGDFQLMHRQHWLELQGYAEFDMYSFHIDSLLQASSQALGLRQVALGEPFRAYHIEHPGSGWRMEIAKDPRHDESIKNGKLQRMSHELLCALQAQMIEQRAPLYLNSPHWGLALYDLPEQNVSRPLEKLPSIRPTGSERAFSPLPSSGAPIDVVSLL